MSCPIVVPLDGTYESERVLPLAVEIAERASAPLVLLRVDETAAGLLRKMGEGGVSHQEAQRRHLDQRYALEVIAADLSSRGVKDVRIALESGSVAPTIVRYARDVNASFVAMSTREGGGMGAVLWGRIAEVVIRDTRLPVLVEPATAVRPRGSKPVGRILVALDGTDLGEVILGPVIELAKLCAAEVTLLHVVGEHALAGGYIDPLIWGGSASRAGYMEAASNYLAQWVERLAAQGVAARLLVSDGGAPSAVIAKQAKEGAADLVALAAHSRTGLARLAISSNVAAMLRYSSLPLLLCHPPLARRCALSSELERELAER